MESRARDLVMQHGWNATCYQILNPGIEHWFSSNAEAVVGYVRRRGLILAAGSPVCASELLASICEEFERYAAESGCRVCYVCAEDRLRSIFSNSKTHSAVALGAQPVWNPKNWSNTLRSRSSLRAQLSRSRNKGVTIAQLPAEEAQQSEELRVVLKDWLKSRGLPPLHFLVEPDVLNGVLTDRLIFAAKRDGKVTAFAVASPIATKSGCQIELLARSPRAPNGTSELLIDAVMTRFAESDGAYVTLGLVALAKNAEKQINENPWWLRTAMKVARVHANRFYNFQGLEQFRMKMLPDRWEPLYAISNEQRFSMRVFYTMGAAFSGIPPWLAIGIAAAKAIKQELKRTP